MESRMPQAKTWYTSVTHLVTCFREGLLALVPVAEKVHMPWREPDAYDDWDVICETLFHQIIVRSIEFATLADHFLPVVPYDKRVEGYGNHSRIGSLEIGGDHAFVCFQTRDEPFDICLFATLDSDGDVSGHVERAFKDTEFAFVGRGQGASKVLSDLEVEL